MAAPKRISLYAALLTLVAAFGSPPLLANGEQDLAKQSQNPVGGFAFPSVVANLCTDCAVKVSRRGGG